jgi:hypothetical protein
VLEVAGDDRELVRHAHAGCEQVWVFDEGALLFQTCVDVRRQDYRLVVKREHFQVGLQVSLVIAHGLPQEGQTPEELVDRRISGMDEFWEVFR